MMYIMCLNYKGKGKVVPLQAWSDPDGSRTLSFPDFITAHNGRKVVRLKHRPPLVSENTSGAYFCYRLSRPRAIVRREGLPLKNCNETIENRTSDFPICCTVVYKLYLQ